MNEQTEPVLLTERRGSTLILSINRPSAGNSVNPALAKSIDDALTMAEADDSVACVILTAAGNRFFCSGMDLKHLAAHGMEGTTFPGSGFAGLTEREFCKPLICAVNGYALGGGTELALCCDLIIAAEHAQFGLPEVKRGIIAATGGPIRLMRAIPRAAAMEILLTGDAVSARRALELGLINRVVPAERLLDEALAMAERITVNAPLSVRGTKEIACKTYGLSIEDAFVVSKGISARIGATEDAREGPRAFAEKRPPVWKGR